MLPYCIYKEEREKRKDNVRKKKREGKQVESIRLNNRKKKKGYTRVNVYSFFFCPSLFLFISYEYFVIVS